jgi:GTP cyclohydrolase II
VDRVALEIKPHECNIAYLKTKKKKLGHMLKHV